MDARTLVDERIQRACHTSDAEGATRLVLEEYGPEVLGYLMAVARDGTYAEDAFALWAEDVWRGIGRFRWESSLRTWLYVIARRALGRVFRAEGPRRNALPLSDCPEIAEVAERVRTRTLPFLRSEAKAGLAQIRESLSAEEQTILVLRHDRKMGWRDVARVMLDEPDPSAAAVKRKENAVKQRYRRLLPRLRELAREAGMLDD